MSILEKQIEFNNELLPISMSFVNGRITLEQYLEKRKELVKKYGFDKGVRYFIK